MNSRPDIAEARIPEYDVDPLFLRRWSARALSGEEVSRSELMSLFEAARWAPSAYNNQPWRFLYARRGTPHWNTFFDLLVEFNQSWARQAAALIVVLANRNFAHNGQPSRTHAYDAGSAVQNLALQATLRGLIVHPMEGFDYDRARTVLRAPEDQAIMCMLAVGRPGNPADLPPALRDREKPSGRKPLAELVHEGPCPA